MLSTYVHRQRCLIGHNGFVSSILSTCAFCAVGMPLPPLVAFWRFQDEPPPGKESVEGIKVQQRCEVQPGGRRGVVEFVGEVEGLQVRVVVVDDVAVFAAAASGAYARDA